MAKRAGTSATTKKKRTRAANTSDSEDDFSESSQSEAEISRKPQKRSRVMKAKAIPEMDLTFVRPKLGGTKRKVKLDAQRRRELQEKNKSENEDNKKRTVKSRLQGKLTVFKGLPFDTLAVVCSFLLPIDILQLSRVSKDFKELFSPHTSRHFWILARRNISGLPDCPSDLNEAQYASLLFEHFCQACDAQRANIIDFALRYRLCKPCHKELTKKGSLIVRHLGTSKRNKPDPIVFSLVPYACYGWFPDDFDDRFADYRHYNIEELTLATKIYVSLESNEEKRKQFVEERQAATKAMMETGKAMFDWESHFKDDKRNNESNIAEARAAETKRRLLELGWTENDLSGNCDLHNLMYQPREITPRIWKQALPKLEASIMQYRRWYRQVEFRQHWGNVVQRCLPASHRIFMPTMHEATELPCIEALLARNRSGVELTQEALTDIFETILKESEQLRVAGKRRFLGLILQAKEYTHSEGKEEHKLPDGEISLDDPRLFYARHLFYCGDRHCSGGPMTLAQVYNHVIISDRHKVKQHTDYSVILAERDGSDLVNVTKEVLKIMGLPEDATVDDVEDYNQKFRLRCKCKSERLYEYASLIHHYSDAMGWHSLLGAVHHKLSNVSELVSVTPLA